MINIFKLNKTRDEKEVQKYETYRKVLEKCHNRLKIQGKKGITHCVFTIPNIIFGLPAYDQVKCAEYCTDRLRKNGFVVVYTYPNLLYISWEHVPSEVKNPEVKSMEVEIMTNPHKDYSQLVYSLNTPNNSNTIEYFNKNLIEYQSMDDNKSHISNRNDIKSIEYRPRDNRSFISNRDNIRSIEYKKNFS